MAKASISMYCTKLCMEKGQTRRGLPFFENSIYLHIRAETTLSCLAADTAVAETSVSANRDEIIRLQKQACAFNRVAVYEDLGLTDQQLTFTAG